jgi:prophage regulatory protein
MNPLTPMTLLLTIDDVMRLTGYKARSSIYRRIHRQDGFPRPVVLGRGRIRWRSSEIEQWLQNLPTQTYS